MEPLSSLLCFSSRVERTGTQSAVTMTMPTTPLWELIRFSVSSTSDIASSRPSAELLCAQTRAANGKQRQRQKTSRSARQGVSAACTSAERVRAPTTTLTTRHRLQGSTLGSGGEVAGERAAERATANLSPLLLCESCAAHRLWQVSCLKPPRSPCSLELWQSARVQTCARSARSSASKASLSLCSPFLSLSTALRQSPVLSTHQSVTVGHWSDLALGCSHASDLATVRDCSSLSPVPVRVCVDDADGEEDDRRAPYCLPMRRMRCLRLLRCMEPSRGSGAVAAERARRR